jgi:parallel beta-helix repeat protein
MMFSFFEMLVRFQTKQSQKRRPVNHHRPRLELLEDRWVPSTLHVNPNGAHGAFTTIQAAVNASHPGNFIAVDPGTYQEQVTITSAHNNIELESTCPFGAVIEAPATLSGSGAIVDVSGASGVEIEGFTITGPGSASSQLQAGVLIENGGSATVEYNHITKIHDATFGGAQEGIGVQVGGLNSSTTGKAVINANLIDAYQKGGIVVTNAGSNATIQDNFVRGVGATPLIAQNGIQISDGATGSIVDNFVTGNQYQSPTQPAQFAAAGILLDQPGSNVNVQDNIVANNDAGIWAVDAVSATIRENLVFGSTLFGIALDVNTTGSTHTTVEENLVLANSGDGIDVFGSSNNTIKCNITADNGGNGIMLDGGATNNAINNNVSIFNKGNGILVTDSTSSGNSITGNAFVGNTGTDAVDASQGSGTAGTANQWSRNLIGTKSPAGLH